MSALARHRAALLIPPATAAIGLVSWLLLPVESLRVWFSEAGPAEHLTEWLFYALGLGVWLLRPRGAGRGATWLALSVFFLACGAREGDLHKHWTGLSVLKGSFYLGDAPLASKLIAAAAVGAFALALLQIVRDLARPFWQRWRRGDTVAVTALSFLVTLVVAKVADRSVNLLVEDYGVAVSLSVRALVGAIEESMEMALPLLGGLALWQYRRPQEPTR